MLFLVFLLTVSLTTLSNQKTYYIDHNTPSGSGDGTKQNPYSSLEEAVSLLGFGSFEFILLGQEISLASVLEIPPDSNYKIKGQASSSDSPFFPLKFQPGASIVVSKGNLTLEDIEIIEIDKDRDPSLSTISLTDGHLVLNRTLVQNIDYLGSYYMLILAGSIEDHSEVTIVECLFKNLKDVLIVPSVSRLTIMRTNFTEITQSFADFFSISSDGSPDFQVLFQNNIVEKLNITSISPEAPTSFLSFYSGIYQVTLEDFIIHDSTIMNGCHFLLVDTITYENDDLGTVQIRNATLENLYESHDPLSDEGQRTGSGLLFETAGNINLVVERLFLKNVLFKYADLLINTFELARQVDSDEEILPSSTIVRDVIIETSTNANFINIGPDMLLENIMLLNTSYNDSAMADEFYPQFFSRDGNQVTIRNITGINHKGPAFRINNITRVDISDCNFTGSTTSQNLTKQNQTFMELIRRNNVTSSGMKIAEARMVTNVVNFNIDGYTIIEGSSSKTESQQTSLILIRSSTGEIHIRNSRWKNVDMICILAYSAKHIEIDNLTVDADPHILPERIARHKIFEFQNLEEMYVTNSQFLNNQNVNVFELFNIREGDFFDEITMTYMEFDNITLINNTANFSDSGGVFPALFNLYSPIKPAIFVFQNSIFQNNKISRGIFLSEATNQLNVSLVNNVFLGNYADGPGTIFSADAMQDEFNDLELINNTFIDNKCEGNGGLFSFVYTKHNIMALNNIYRGIYSGGSGGVGYTFKTKLFYSETNGTYSGTYANNFGGSWVFSSNRNDNKISQVNFTNTTFEKSSAFQKGGALYIAQGDISITNCLFQDNKATDAGGDIYLLTSSTLQLDTVEFRRSSAQKGAWLFAEAMSNEFLVFKNIKVTDLFSERPDGVAMISTGGSISILNSQFRNISEPLFSLDACSITLQNSDITNIICNTTLSYCVLEGNSLDLTFKDTKVAGIISTADLISIENSVADFSNVEFSEMRKYQSKNDRLFVIRAASGKTLSIVNSSFSQIDLSSINVHSSSLSIANTLFNNALIGQRSLQKNKSKKLDINSSLQFIVLNSSNSSIVDSSFLGGIVTDHSNGGAIQIVGNRGSHYITQCIFQSNRGLNGGAISIEGIAESIEIANSVFENNKATLTGGCISFEDLSKDLSIQQKLNCLGTDMTIKFIENSFKSNEGFRGGCLYIGNQSAWIQKSSFEKNHAIEGGAIVSVSQDEYARVIIEDSTFFENTATIGSALMAFGNLNFDIKTTAFNNNTAEFGNYITTKPYELRMKIYQFDETFLFLNTITPKRIICDNNTILIYDSLEPNVIPPLVFKSGRPPSYLFEFTLLDQLQQNATMVNYPELVISIKDASFPKGIRPSLLGKTKYSFEKGSGRLILYNSFSVRGSFGTILTLSATASFENPLNGRNDSVPPQEWRVRLGTCSQGEIYDKVNVVCSPCPEGTFSFEDPLTAQSCQKCQGPLICKGSNIVCPQKGYWKIDRTSDNVIKCLNEDACLGGEIDGGTSISLTGFCNVGYEGLACADCSPGYAKFGIRGSNKGTFFIKLLIQVLQPIFLILASAIVWILIYKLTRRKIWSNKEFRTKLWVTSAIIVYILQPNIVKATFQLFKYFERIYQILKLTSCDNFGTTSSPKYYMIEDTSTECWQSHHLMWALGLGIPSLIIWFVIPSFLSIWWTRKERINVARGRAKKYSFMFARYNHKSEYWEVIILGRKIFLIVLAVFIKSEYLQAYLGAFTLVFAYYFQITSHPFYDGGLNISEQLSLFSSACIFYSGLYFIRENHSETVALVLLIADALTGAIFLGYCLYLVHRLIKQKLVLLREALQKLLENQSTLGRFYRRFSRTGSRTSTIGTIIQIKTEERMDQLDRQLPMVTELIGKQLLRKHSEEKPMSTSCLEEDGDSDFSVLPKRLCNSFIIHRKVPISSPVKRGNEILTLSSLQFDFNINKELCENESEETPRDLQEEVAYKGTLDDLMEFEERKSESELPEIEEKEKNTTIFNNTRDEEGVGNSKERIEKAESYQEAEIITLSDVLQGDGYLSLRDESSENRESE